MRKGLIASAAGIVMLAGATLTAPARGEGFYGSLNAGASFLDTTRNFGSGIDIDSRSDTGWALSGGVGYAYTNGLRAELELGYRRHGIKDLFVRSDGGLGASLGVGGPLNGATLAAEGHETSFSGMVNGWYDIKTGTAFTPYVGGGIGLSRIALNGIKISDFQIVDDSDVVFAYQFGAGVAYAVTPSISLTVDYRYFATTDAAFRDFEGAKFRADYSTHNVMGGVRFGF